METTCREAWHVLRRNPLPRQKNLKPLQRCSWSCGKFSSFKCWRSLWHFSGMWACGIRRLTVKKILCKNSRVSFIIKDLKLREHWRTGRNRKLVFSLFQCADSANSYSMNQNKAFRFVVWERSVPSSETSNFRLLVMTSVTSAFSLLMHTIRRTPWQQSLSFPCSDPEWFCVDRVRSLLSMRGILLGYSFEPTANNRVLATAWSFMTVGLSLNRCSHSRKTV